MMDHSKSVGILSTKTGNGVTPPVHTKWVVGNGVTLSLLFVWWMCLGLSAEAPTSVVKRTIDEVIRLVTDEQLKAPEQVSHRRRLSEVVIGQNFDFDEMAKRGLASVW